MPSDLRFNTGAEIPSEQASLLKGALANIWGQILGTKLDLNFALKQLQFILNSTKLDQSKLCNIWRTIDVADLPQKGVLKQELKSVGAKIDTTVLNTLSNYDKDQKVLIDLVKLTVEDLGFERPVQLKKIYEVAQNCGLMTCMEIVGPRLRKSYVDQPVNEGLVVATEPFAGGDGKLYLFEIANDRKTGLELNAIPVGPKREFLPDDMFVFMR